MCEIYIKHARIFIGIYRHICIDDMKKENPGIVKVTVLCQRSTYWRNKKSSPTISVYFSQLSTYLTNGEIQLQTNKIVYKLRKSKNLHIRIEKLEKKVTRRRAKLFSRRIAVMSVPH